MQLLFILAEAQLTILIVKFSIHILHVICGESTY